jgi:plasmid stabilization system protein ParE
VSRSRFVLTAQARADLLEIWNYIAEDSPENADRVLERLYAAFKRLAETPGMGHHRKTWRLLPSSTELVSRRRSSSTGSARRLPNNRGASSRHGRCGNKGDVVFVERLSTQAFRGR